MKLFVAMTLMAGMFLANPLNADDKEEVAGLAKKATTNIVNLLKDKSLASDVLKEKVRAEIETVFDFPLTAKLTLGRAYWPTLNEDQRKEFQDLFVKNIINSYYDKAKQFADEKIVYGDPEMVKNKIHIKISFVSKGENITINNKFYKGKNGWMIYDMEIQDVSIVRSYSSQYTEVLKDGTPEELLKKMREKLAEPESSDIAKDGK